MDNNLINMSQERIEGSPVEKYSAKAILLAWAEGEEHELLFGNAVEVARTLRDLVNDGATLTKKQAEFTKHRVIGLTSALEKGLSKHHDQDVMILATFINSCK